METDLLQRETQKFPSATEGLAGRKAGGCLGKEQDALGEWMNEQHPTHFPDRWCQCVNCSSHKKCSYVVSNNSVFPWWPWQWALLLTTHQQSPWCHGEKSWLRDNLGGPESNSGHNTHSSTSILFIHQENPSQRERWHVWEAAYEKAVQLCSLTSLPPDAAHSTDQL